MTGNDGVWRAAIVSIGVLLVAANCSGPTNDGSGVVDVERTHKINVTSHFVTTPIAVPGDGGALAPAEQAKLSGIVEDFIQVGGGILEVAAPAGAGGNVRALARASVVRDHVLKLGVLPREVEMRLSSVAENGPVVVSYERFTATPPTCRPTTENMAFNPRNLSQDTFGCATQHNRAVSISNPADFVRMRGGRSADATRRSKVIRDYRAGAHTSSANSASTGL